MEKLPDGMSTSEGFNSSHLLKQQETTWGLAREDIVHKLGVTFDAAVQVEDVQPVRGCDLPSDENDVNDLVFDSGDSDAESPNNFLGKCDMFPTRSNLSCKSGVVKDTIPHSELHQNGNYSRSITFPPPRKLVSAMKGSHEKEGSQSRKLKVSWAPDVFDPPPTAASHTLKNTTRKRIKKSRKHVKGKQKGKPMRTKARENYQKMSGRSLRHLDSNANTEGLMLRDNMSPAEQLNIDDGNDTDSGCGPGFYRKSMVACVSLMLRLPNSTNVTVDVDFSLR